MSWNDHHDPADCRMYMSHPVGMGNNHKYAIEVTRTRSLSGNAEEADLIRWLHIDSGKYGAAVAYRHGNKLISWNRDWAIPSKPGISYPMKGIGRDYKTLFACSYKVARGMVENAIALNKQREEVYIRKLDKPDPKSAVGIPAQTETKQATSEIQMNTQEMINIMQLKGGATIVSAQYLDDNSGRVYHFKNALKLDLKKGDMIAVETRGTFALVTVVDPSVMPTEIDCAMSELKHVVAKMQSDEFKRVKEAENNAFQALALSEVTSKLDTFKDQIGSGAFNAVAGMIGVDPAQDNLSGQDTIESDVVDNQG